jgi:hypothetical protein
VPALAAALAGVFALAVVLPTWAVRTMHARRLVAADAELIRLAGVLSGTDGWPRDAVLSGPGDAPRGLSASVIPWARLVADELPPGPDPWGNAYLAYRLDAFRSDARVCVLSAGPDGVLQTPFDPSICSALGDDRAALR